MGRKTIDVDLLVEACNGVLAISDDRITWFAGDAVSYRRGVIGVCEQALHMADRYKGFSYLPSELESPGKLRDGYDDTRRRYSV